MRELLLSSCAFSNCLRLEEFCAYRQLKLKDIQSYLKYFIKARTNIIGMQEILSVSELTASIKKHLESRFLTIYVKGEISNFKEQASGHLYFTLKDQESQISAVLFRGNAHTLKRLPKNGDQVIVQGEISVYAPRGSYQIIIRKLDYLGL